LRDRIAYTSAATITLLCFFLTLFASPFKSKSRLEAENVVLRRQAEKLALKEIAHEPENTSIAEPAAEPAAAPDDADGVLVVREEFKS
jgi:hypothetical protein